MVRVVAFSLGIGLAVSALGGPPNRLMKSSSSEMGMKGGADGSSADAADGEAGSAECPDCTKLGRIR